MSDERVAILETQREQDRSTLQDMVEKLDTVADDVQNIRLQLEKQKGFFAGCMFILLPIWSGITAIAITFWDRLTDTGAS